MFINLKITDKDLKYLEDTRLILTLLAKDAKNVDGKLIKAKESFAGMARELKDILALSDKFMKGELTLHSDEGSQRFDEAAIKGLELKLAILERVVEPGNRFSKKELSGGEDAQMARMNNFISQPDNEILRGFDVMDRQQKTTYLQNLTASHLNFYRDALDMAVKQLAGSNKHISNADMETLKRMPKEIGRILGLDKKQEIGLS